MREVRREITSAVGTLDALFRERVRLSPDTVAYRGFDRATKTWRDTTWSDMAALADRWTAAFRAEGLRPGDRVAVQIRNCEAWVGFEQGALAAGLVVVPLYVDDRPDSVGYILHDAGVKLLLIRSSIQWNKILESNEHTVLDSVARVLLLEPDTHDERPARDADRTTALDDWLGPGGGVAQPEPHEPSALATIAYTSGTTGRPKGVMLSHANILSTTSAALEVIDVSSEDRLLSFLPLSHTFERTCGYYGPMMAGATVVFARSVQQLADDLTTQAPSMIICVPRIFERFYDRLQTQLDGQSALSRALFRATTRVGWRHFLARHGRCRHGLEQLAWPVLRRIVASRVHQRLGGRLRLAVCGGAAMPVEVSRLFLSLGMEVAQGYGMTEASPVISTNTQRENEPASVGRPLPGVETRIGENDELLVRSPGVMMGYWNDPEATRATVDTEGWLHTGDKARIEHGFVFITGRIKDILVLSNGENVPPGDVEAAITAAPLFEQALVLGEGKPYLSALVVLNPALWPALAKAHGLDPSEQSALEDPALRKDLVRRVAGLLHDFPGYAKVRRVAALLEPWSIENGLLTPTLKTKRAPIIEHCAEAVARLYD